MSKLSVVTCDWEVWFLAHRKTPYHSWVELGRVVPAGSPATYCESSVLYRLSSREHWCWEVWFWAPRRTPYHSWVELGRVVPAGSPVTYCESSVLYRLSSREICSW